jgi:ankyrin repeat protein
MSALLRSDDRIELNGVKTSSQLAGYAAEHWATHARYENVSSYLRKAMEYLFDLDKPYFSAWRDLHDIDTYSTSGSTFHMFTLRSKSIAVPLYYAALCGFQELVEHLILKHPEHVNARGGHYVTPLVAALAREHFQVAGILYDNGAHPNVRGSAESTPLHAAAWRGRLQMVQVLLGYKADVNARNGSGQTPLFYLSENSPVSDFSQSPTNVARVLLEHSADINACSDGHVMPLHLAVRRRNIDLIRVLLEHGASVEDAEDSCGETPFQAARDSDPDIIKLLSEHGAK